jgi:hypothetical protein
MKTIKQLTSILLLVILISCNSHNKKNKPVGTNDWLEGSENQKIETLAKHLRGFDMAMVETGYRYQELYWAGKDENWEYADYQIEKLRIAIENGLERRPNRAKSAEHFLNVALPEMNKAVEQKDTAIFNENFQMLTNSCIACHAMEKVPHFTVKKPLHRQSPIRK